MKVSKHCPYDGVKIIAYTQDEKGELESGDEVRVFRVRVKQPALSVTWYEKRLFAFG